MPALLIQGLSMLTSIKISICQVGKGFFAVAVLILFQGLFLYTGQAVAGKSVIATDLVSNPPSASDASPLVLARLGNQRNTRRYRRCRYVTRYRTHCHTRRRPVRRCRIERRPMTRCRQVPVRRRHCVTRYRRVRRCYGPLGQRNCHIRRVPYRHCRTQVRYVRRCKRYYRRVRHCHVIHRSRRVCTRRPYRVRKCRTYYRRY